VFLAIEFQRIVDAAGLLVAGWLVASYYIEKCSVYNFRISKNFTVFSIVFSVTKTPYLHIISVTEITR